MAVKSKYDVSQSLLIYVCVLELRTLASNWVAEFGFSDKKIQNLPSKEQIQTGDLGPILQNIFTRLFTRLSYLIDCMLRSFTCG